MAPLSFSLKRARPWHFTNKASARQTKWYTPLHLQKLGCTFDTDAASPGKDVTPWIPAKRFIDCHSLAAPWHGYTWLNPPFGARNGLVPWLEKFFAHGDGICLVPDRTSAPWWQTFAPRADLILLVSPKIKFIDANGAPGASPAQGTCLLAAGERGCEALERAAREGLGILMRPVPVVRTLPAASVAEQVLYG